ncbi:DUF11 domain-containing protein [Pleurocapsa sp. PCC 7319]|uniref:DUF11 domain-containing protein n=1 Tax=Pleurocapsa sp. PCC 7319 TaxID=118161 RepID=UPI00036287CA|nr:DUF11 domain-containing protein [Pleurocapsa sp. PCC 7319]
MKTISKLELNPQKLDLIRKLPSCWLSISLTVLATLLSSLPAYGEGSFQIGLNQPMYEYNGSSTLILPINRPQYVDIVQAGEVINISLCGDSDTDPVQVEIYNSLGFEVFDTGIVASNLSCSDPLNAPLNNPFRYVTTADDTYEIRLFNRSGTFINRFDITVTSDDVTNPDPTEAQGRLYAESWAFNANGYGLDESADTNYYTLVPGGRQGENFVWLLDLNNFAGFVYEIVANPIGVDAPNSGLSTPTGGNNITPEYPIYLSYPVITGPRPTIPPNVAGFSFIDDQGIDNSISPGGTTGVQDSGTFQFTTDIDGTYAITIDTNQDGIYGVGDTQLLGLATPGANSVFWDGRDNQGQVLPEGTYDAQLQVRLGEYHFIAADVETSGGGTNNGLTIFEAFSNISSSDTLVFWDDSTLLAGTTTLPNGALSSTPQGKHTWGNFTAGGFGNNRFIDTYVYGDITIATSQVIIEITDTPQATTPNLLLVKRITAINPGQPDEIQFNDFVDDSSADDNDPNWPDSDDTPNNVNTYLRGAINGGQVKPGDEVEYTIYFLSNGDGDAENVSICDVIPDNTTFVQNSYDFEFGIALALDETNLPTTPNQTFSNLVGDDQGNFYEAGTNPPNGLCKKVDSGNPPSLIDVNGANNINGAVVVDLGSSLPTANEPENPFSYYGFIRFRVQVQ